MAPATSDATRWSADGRPHDRASSRPGLRIGAALVRLRAPAVRSHDPSRVSRFVDRGAVVGAYVGIGMALVISMSFLLVIPIEPIFWIAALPAGLLIGYYANQRSDRRAGPTWRIVVNGLFAGAATGLTMAVLLLAVKGLFFNADDGYRDPGLGGPITCQTGADCVYQRYLEEQGSNLAEAGITDAASFADSYWAQQWATAGGVLIVTLGGSFGGLGLYWIARPRPKKGADPAAGASSAA